MTHLFVCDACQLQSQPGTRTGGTPRGWTTAYEPGEHATHECHQCAGRSALRRVAERAKGEPLAEYEIKPAAPVMEAAEVKALADHARPMQPSLFGSDV